MSLFDKLIFVADYIEEGREHTSCIAAREHFFSMIEGGVSPEKALDQILLSILEGTIQYLNARGFSICEDTILARDAILSTISSN